MYTPAAFSCPCPVTLVVSGPNYFRVSHEPFVWRELLVVGHGRRTQFWNNAGR